MDTMETKSNTQEKADSGRRSFLWKVGAGMSAVIAATVPAAAMPLLGSDKKIKADADSLSKQVEVLENEKNIRELHKAYEDLLTKGMYSEVPAMFTADAKVIFNGGLYKGRKSVERLFTEHFSSGMTGKKIESAPGFELKPEQQQDMVEISPDKKSAKAQFTYSIQVGAPMALDSTLAQMARLSGEGIIKWWEGGVYKVSYVKEMKNRSWKIKSLEYNTLSTADYKSGWSYAKPISVPGFREVYPADPSGPDRLV